MTISPKLVSWAITPLSGLVDGILLLSEQVVPPADLKLARFYSQTLRHAEAAEEYAWVLHYHPRHVDAYLEGIRAASLARDERLARKLYQGAQKALRSPERRRLLDEAYSARHQAPESMEEAGLEALPETSASDPGEHQVP